MTTYTLQGFGTTQSDNKLVSAMELAFFLPDGKSSFSYTKTNYREDGDPHFNVEINLPKGAHWYIGSDNATTDGESLIQHNNGEYRIGNIVWDSGDTVWFRLYHSGDEDVPYGYFSLAGPAVMPQTQAEWEDFIDNADFDNSGMVGSGPFRPDVDINLANLPGVTITENDDLVLTDLDDLYVKTGLGNDKVHGLDGNDGISGGKGKDKLWGDDGNDTVDGGNGKDKVYGDDGNDLLSGGAGNDSVSGGRGNDTIRGGTDKDKLYGGKGVDLLNGDAGNDQLWGDKGGDTFKFSKAFGADVIRDFDPSASGEVVDLDKVKPIKNWRDLKNNHLSENTDGDAVIDDGNGNTITLIDVNMGDLSKGDFLF